MVVVGQLLHGNAHDSPCDRPDGHAGDEQARWYLETGNGISIDTGMQGETSALFWEKNIIWDHLESKCEYGHDYLKDECQAELPHGGVDAGPRRPVGVVGEGLAAVHLAAVLAELRGLQRAAVGEQLLYQLAGVLTRVRIWESNYSCDGRHQDHLQNRVLA